MKFVNSNLARVDFDKEVPFLYFPILKDIPFIKHGFSTRLGGVSAGIFSSMNLGNEGPVSGDNPENIRRNYERICASMDIDPKTLVVSKQVHKTNIRLVDEKDLGKGYDIPRDFDEIDGLITDCPGITLVTKYADCVPLFLIDTKRKAIGLSHSGWRGTVGKIGLHTVHEMQKHFGTNPEDLIAVIGPSICMACYEVSEEVALQFQDVFNLDGNDIGKGQNSHPDHPIILQKNDLGRYQLNLWEANKMIFREAGLKEDRIHVSGVCTACNSDLLFSHRKTNGKRGSLAAFLGIQAWV